MILDEICATFWALSVIIFGGSQISAHLVFGLLRLESRRRCCLLRLRSEDDVEDDDDGLVKPPLKILAPTNLLVLSVIGITEAYGALIGPNSSATLPILLPDPSMSSSPALMPAPAALSLTINLPLFARCITSPISPNLLRGIS